MYTLDSDLRLTCITHNILSPKQIIWRASCHDYTCICFVCVCEFIFRIIIFVWLFLLLFLLLQMYKYNLGKIRSERHASFAGQIRTGDRKKYIEIRIFIYFYKRLKNNSFCCCDQAERLKCGTTSFYVNIFYKSQIMWGIYRDILFTQRAKVVFFPASSLQGCTVVTL